MQKRKYEHTTIYKIRKFSHATKFDDWLIKIGDFNYNGYLLPRWTRIKIILNNRLPSKRKLKWFLLWFLIFGLYTDIRLVNPYVDNEPSICNGAYRQRAAVVQFVVPFRPERETFYLAWGNKHFEYEVDYYTYTNSKGETKTQKNESGCASYIGRYGMLGRHSHLIDLRFLF